MLFDLLDHTKIYENNSEGSLLVSLPRDEEIGQFDVPVHVSRGVEHLQYLFTFNK